MCQTTYLSAAVTNAPRPRFPPPIKLKNFKYFIYRLIDDAGRPVIDQAGQIRALGTVAARPQLNPTPGGHSGHRREAILLLLCRQLNRQPLRIRRQLHVSEAGRELLAVQFAIVLVELLQGKNEWVRVLRDRCCAAWYFSGRIGWHLVAVVIVVVVVGQRCVIASVFFKSITKTLPKISTLPNYIID